jgi:hypothetical protein
MMILVILRLVRSHWHPGSDCNTRVQQHDLESCQAEWPPGSYWFIRVYTSGKRTAWISQNENVYPGWECISLDNLGYLRIYILIRVLGYPWISKDIQGYMETVRPKIFMLEDHGNFFFYDVWICMHTSPTHLTLYPVVKSEKIYVQTIHLVNSVFTSIYQYILGCPGTYYT